MEQAFGAQIKVDGKYYSYMGEGAQSKVYVFGDEILKIPLSPEEIVNKSRTIPSDRGGQLTHEEAATAYRKWLSLIESARIRIGTNTSASELFGGLRIDADHRMFQRRVLIIEDTLGLDALRDEHFTKKLIDDFAALHVAMWRYGVCETECSLLSNYGRDRATGALVCTDFGSASFEFEIATRSVGEPLSWSDASAFMSRSPVHIGRDYPDWFSKGQVREALREFPNLLKYYVETMSGILTRENLEGVWDRARGI